jgi:hypothetical protein
MNVRASALDLIGRTPLVELRRIHPGPGRLLAKAVVTILCDTGSSTDSSPVDFTHPRSTQG